MSVVLLDTVGLLALWDEDDQWHADAAEAFGKLMTQKLQPVTTTFVMLECGNAAARRPYRLRVNALRQTMAARGEVVLPREDDWQLVWQAYDRGERATAKRTIWQCFIARQPGGNGLCSLFAVH